MKDEKVERLMRAIDRADNEKRLAKSLAMAAQMRFEECRTELHLKNARLMAADSQLTKAKEALTSHERHKTD